MREQTEQLHHNPAQITLEYGNLNQFFSRVQDLAGFLQHLPQFPELEKRLHGLTSPSLLLISLGANPGPSPIQEALTLTVPLPEETTGTLAVFLPDILNQLAETLGTNREKDTVRRTDPSYDYEKQGIAYLRELAEQTQGFYAMITVSEGSKGSFDLKTPIQYPEPLIKSLLE